MLAVIQFPFTDVRRFLDVDTGRLDKPAWPMAKAGSDFVRSFGIIQRRLRGGIMEWPGEEVYCKAPRALRFNQPVLTFRLPSNPRINLTRLCAFRRLLADGYAVARYELGFAFQKEPTRRLRGLRRSQDFIGLSKFVLTQQVSFAVDHGGRGTCELIDADKYLAQQYLKASTHCNANNNLEEWWVSPSSPLLLIEIRRLVSKIPQIYAHCEFRGIETGRYPTITSINRL
jgi:hypothetical protein